MKLELLSPARDAEVARQAILHGADAVYIGGPTHGARAAASNSIDEIKEVVKFAHQYGARVYVTFNTIIYPQEIHRAEALIWELWQVGVDALIVQDMGILRMRIPPIALHASTQCDIRTPQKARFLAQCGFSQLVLAREMTEQEIKATRATVPAEVALEAFVHGALCVSYSGDCHASCAANGRSANRGECAQMCRMAYDLVDGDGNVLARDKHLLSLRDLCRLDDIELMAQAGVSSFKIEGRLKDANYVKNATWAYRQALDRLISKHPDLYERSSYGISQVDFTADVNKAFNRGFTSYFFHGVGNAPLGMVNYDTPKWIGEKVGVVKANNRGSLTATLSADLNNGDGLGYFDSKGQFVGFRLNRVDGNRLFPAASVDAKAGDTLYRNRNVARDRLLEGDTAKRTLSIDFTLRSCNGHICLKAAAESGSAAEVALPCQLDTAKSPQKEPRQRVLSKIGDTIYRIGSITDEIDADLFVPASVLANLRRDAIAALERDARATYAYEKRLPEQKDAPLPGPARLDYHYNVANPLAEEFYRSHGASEIEPAMELQHDSPKGKAVMTTRYCLRREMGACLKTPNASQLPANLYLKNKAAQYQLAFDCARCQMRLLHL